jgi:NAD(P) transhydrogenase subunit alpha
MKILVPKETASGENRVAITPDVTKKYVGLGCEVTVQKGAGEGAGFTDDAYKEAGASIAVKMDSHYGNADIVLRLNKPTVDDVKVLKKGAIHISYMDPTNDTELVKAFQEAGVSGISMEFVPRTTLAQKMDALSSQANLGGYVAVVLGAERMSKILPMLMTPAGTIPPSRVFIIGAGVAGLQAIATAKRMGARVEAFDTRPAVKEQVESLGAKFVEVDLGEMGETDQGYAKELTPEQLAKQQEVMAQRAAQADLDHHHRPGVWPQSSCDPEKRNGGCIQTWRHRCH